MKFYTCDLDVPDSDTALAYQSSAIHFIMIPRQRWVCGKGW